MVRVSFILFLMTSVLVALVSFRFIPLGLELSFPDMDLHIAERRLAFLSHVIAASLALLFGVAQFLSGLRGKYPRVHRWTGRFYVVFVLVAGVAGFVLAFDAMGGPIAGWGFGLLSVLWVFTTLQGLRFARNRKFGDHRRWMMRSFALTFAAVTLRLQLAGMIGIGQMTYADASLILAWSCWVPNLILVEWLIARKPSALFAQAAK